MITRIGQIRDVVSAHGGNNDFRYFVDGPASSLGLNSDRNKKDKYPGSTYKMYVRELGVKDIEALKYGIWEIPDVVAVWVTRHGGLKVYFEKC